MFRSLVCIQSVGLKRRLTLFFVPDGCKVFFETLLNWVDRASISVFPRDTFCLWTFSSEKIFDITEFSRYCLAFCNNQPLHDVRWKKCPKKCQAKSNPEEKIRGRHIYLMAYGQQQQQQYDFLDLSPNRIHSLCRWKQKTAFPQHSKKTNGQTWIYCVEKLGR